MSVTPSQFTNLSTTRIIIDRNNMMQNNVDNIIAQPSFPTLRRMIAPLRLLGRVLKWILVRVYRWFKPLPEITPFYGTQFEEALQNGRFSRILRRLRKRSIEPVSYEALRGHLNVRSQHDRGIETVAVKDIIGSVGRVSDFDRDFMPISKQARERWASIENILKQGSEFPVVELYRIGDFYFVIDGNHRVSVSRYYGFEYIDAHVIELSIEEDIRTTTEARMIYANC